MHRHKKVEINDETKAKTLFIASNFNFASSFEDYSRHYAMEFNCFMAMHYQVLCLQSQL